MQREKVTEQDVKAANQKLYDTIADRYEEIDGRRSPTLKIWLRKKLSDIRQQAPGGCLLDIGTGSGLVTRCAEGLFLLRAGIDLSPKILAANQRALDFGVTADVDHLPFADNSFDVVTCFAVLHHLYAFEALVSEVARVLKPQGIFYSDHDMDAAFNKRFFMPLLLYRKFHNAKSNYQRANRKITPELYELTEWHEDGINSSDLVSLFKQVGFSLKVKFHWFGLTAITNRLFGEKTYPCSWAPVISILAIKNS